MKQIIVNVSGLSVEEKQRVNEALAKIKGVRKIPLINSSAGWFFAPASAGTNTVSWGWSSTPETPTHTPQQVLEMAGMAENRKVRKDFDPTKEYSVDVSNCTEDEKKQVQQAFFDVGLHWPRVLTEEEYQCLDASQYTNTSSDGMVTRSLLMSHNTKSCSITPEEFLELVYEPEQQGHVHADLMALYAEDALTNPEPWKLWQIKAGSSDWISCKFSPAWDPCCQFRRKPKNHTVNGVEVPDLRFEPNEGEEYYMPNPVDTYLYLGTTCTAHEAHDHRKDNNLCYENTEAGKQAAIMHAKAWLGVA